MIYKTPLTTKYQATLTPLFLLLQCNLSNPTHKGPGKYVGLHRVLENSGFIYS